MGAANINRVVITGNLTRDPELRTLQSGTSVCSLRIASNGRQKREGEWVDKANYFSVTVWGAQGENGKREAIEIVAESVQFLGGREDGGGNGSAQRTEVPAATSDFAPQPAASAAPADDDIPF
jgi:single-strand DNA-binding protein